MLFYINIVNRMLILRNFTSALTTWHYRFLTDRNNMSLLVSSITYRIVVDNRSPLSLQYRQTSGIESAVAESYYSCFSAKYITEMLQRPFRLIPIYSGTYCIVKPFVFVIIQPSAECSDTVIGSRFYV